MIKAIRSALRKRGDSIVSFAAFVILLTVIIDTNLRLREMMVRRVDGLNLAGAGTQFQNLTATAATSAQAQFSEYTPLWSFVALATVLTVWMLRS